VLPKKEKEKENVVYIHNGILLSLQKEKIQVSSTI
jgi:hypothetical protein